MNIGVLSRMELTEGKQYFNLRGKGEVAAGNGVGGPIGAVFHLTK